MTQAKLLAAVVVMLLAGFDRPECQHHRSNSFCSPLLCAPSPVGPEQQQLPEHTEVNPHPPFRGVFRDALHAQGLLPAVLGLVMHSSSNSSTAEDHEQQAFDLGTHDRHTVSHFTPPCSSPLFDDGQGTRTLIGQVRGNAVVLLLPECFLGSYLRLLGWTPCQSTPAQLRQAGSNTFHSSEPSQSAGVGPY